MVKDKRNKNIILIIALAVLLVLMFILGLALGSTFISPGDVIKGLFDNSSGVTQSVIVRSVRLPRVLGGLFAGIGLSVAGVILQGVMNNALASPSTIGVGSGAGFFVMLAMVLFPRKIFLQPVFAFLGALTASLLIFALAYFADTSRIAIILAGITVSSFLTAGINLLKTLNTDMVLNVNSFLIGSLSGTSGSKILIPSIAIAAATVIAMFMARSLNLLGLGEETAGSLGMNVGFVRFLLIMISSVLAGCVVSYAGLLSFAGLIVPHICRRLFGNDARLLLPCSALLGGSFVIFCDLVSRVAFRPYELPTGILMAFVGGPFFMYLLLRKKGGRRIK